MKYTVPIDIDLYDLFQQAEIDEIVEAVEKTNTLMHIYNIWPNEEEVKELIEHIKEEEV